MKILQKAALVYVLILAGFVYGYVVAGFQVPPHDFLEARVSEVRAFLAGDAIDKDVGTLGKLLSDTGLIPKRYIRKHPENLGIPRTSLPLPGLNSRRSEPQVYIDEDEKSGYRFIIGAMDFEAAFWGAVLIDREGRVVNTWHFSTEHLEGNVWPDLRKVLYGSYIGSDGSVIFSMQDLAGGLVKVDACSNEIWNLPGKYHHTVSEDGHGAFWSFTGDQSTFDQDMVKVSVETGEILKTIDMTEVRGKNKSVYIWNLRSPFKVDWAELKASDHMTHGNDIHPLEKELAPAFDQFEEGDLLISYASTNLIFVLDPGTLEVKWWRVGIADYQHDPDWEPDGRISLFNNREREEASAGKYSEIVSIDPKTYKSEVTFRSEDPLFLSRFNGRHQLTGFGTRMITSANQGWAFEVDEDGKIVFSFLNAYNDKESLFLSNALRLPEDYFDGKPWEDCKPLNG